MSFCIILELLLKSYYALLILDSHVTDWQRYTFFEIVF